MKAKISIFINFIFCLILLVTFISCNKVSHNGALDGNWRIVSIENIEDGTITKPKQYFIAFQLHVVRLYPSGITGNMHYEKDESLIILDFPYSNDELGRLSLAEYGIESNPISFKIIKNTSNHLILRSSNNILYCEIF